MCHYVIFHNNHFPVLVYYFTYTLNDGVRQPFVCWTLDNVNALEPVNSMDMLLHIGNPLLNLV